MHIYGENMPEVWKSAHTSTTQKKEKGECDKCGWANICKTNTLFGYINA